MNDTDHAAAALPLGRQLDLLRHQLAGLTAWAAHRCSPQVRAAVDAALDLLAAADGEPFDGGAVRPAAVVVGPDPGRRAALAAVLAQCSLRVVASSSDAYEGAAAVLWEQPDLVVVTGTGHAVDVAALAAACAPRAVVGVEAANDGAAVEALVSGASAAWSPGTPPAEVVAGLLDALRQNASGPESLERPKIR